MAIQTLAYTMVTNGSLENGFSSPGFDVSEFGSYLIQVAYTYVLAEDSAGAIKLQCSADNVTFSDVENASIAYTAASTSDGFDVSSFGYKYIKVVCTNSSGTGGTATIKFHGRIHN